jgi:putative Holliday junction resolvase
VTVPPRRILAIDFGDKRTGLAATDYTGTIATPLPALVGLSDPECVAAIRRLVRERDAELVVIGLPLDTSGEEGKRARRTRAFMDLLAKDLPCPIDTIDESYTTDEAFELLGGTGLKASRRKKLVDSVAALVILNRYRSL